MGQRGKRAGPAVDFAEQALVLVPGHERVVVARLPAQQLVYAVHDDVAAPADDAPLHAVEGDETRGAGLRGLLEVAGAVEQAHAGLGVVVLEDAQEAGVQRGRRVLKVLQGHHRQPVLVTIRVGGSARVRTEAVVQRWVMSDFSLVN